jgi:hypothetical protein
MIKKAVFLLLMLSFQTLFAQKLVRFKKQGKVGLFDTQTKRTKVPAIYENITTITYGFIAEKHILDEQISVEKFWINPRGEVLEDLVVVGSDFSDGVLLCYNKARNQEITYINPDGKVVLTGHYDKSTSFSEGYALVSQDGNTMDGYNPEQAKVYLIDKNGKQAFQEVLDRLGKITFDENSVFQKGRILLKSTGDDVFLMDNHGRTQSIAELISKKIKKLSKIKKGDYGIHPRNFHLDEQGWLIADVRNGVSGDPDLVRYEQLVFDAKYNLVLPDKNIVYISEVLDGRRLVLHREYKAGRNSYEYEDKAFLVDAEWKIIKELKGKNIKEGTLHSLPDNTLLIFDEQSQQAVILDKKLNYVSDAQIQIDAQKIVVKMPSKEIFVLPLMEKISSKIKIQGFSVGKQVEKILMCSYFDNMTEVLQERDIACQDSKKCLDCIIAFQANGKTGGFDHLGNIVIKPEYDKWKNCFSENNRTIAQKNGKWGEIDRTNQTIAPFDIEDFNLTEFVPFTKKNGKWGVDNLLEHQFEECPKILTDKMADGYTAMLSVQKNGKKGLIYIKKEDNDSPTKIREILPYEYDEITYDNNKKEVIAIQAGKKYFFSTNDSIFPYEYEEIEKTYFRGRYDTHRIAKKNGKWGIIEWETEKVIIPFEYDKLEIRFYQDEFIFARKNGKHGIISLENKVLVPFEFDFVSRNFGENGAYFLVEKNSKQGIMKENKYIIPLEYDEVGYFHTHPNLLIGVKKGKKWGFLNHKFQVVLPFEYQEDENGCDGFFFNKLISPQKEFSLASLRKRGKRGIVDNKGKILLPFEYDSIYNTWNEENITEPIYKATKNGNKFDIYWNGKSFTVKSSK